MPVAGEHQRAGGQVLAGGDAAVDIAQPELPRLRGLLDAVDHHLLDDAAPTLVFCSPEVVAAHRENAPGLDDGLLEAAGPNDRRKGRQERIAYLLGALVAGAGHLFAGKPIRGALHAFFFVLLMVYISALLASPVILGFFLGKLFWRDLCKRKACIAAELPIGIAIWAILLCIPVLSFAVNFVCAPLGLGVVTLLLGRGRKKLCAQPVEPLPLPETPAPDASVKDAEQPEA